MQVGVEEKSELEIAILFPKEYRWYLQLWNEGYHLGKTREVDTYPKEVQGKSNSLSQVEEERHGGKFDKGE